MIHKNFGMENEPMSEIPIFGLCPPITLNAIGLKDKKYLCTHFNTFCKNYHSIKNINFQ